MARSSVRQPGGERGARDDWFVRAAGFVGDLGNPFYDEERQRDVWNEASAVGFQVALSLGLLVATVAVWAGGPAALPAAVAVLLVLGVSSLVSLTYALRLGVDATANARLLRPRMVPFLALYALLAVGIARAARDSGSDLGDGFAVGIVVGGLGAVLATAVPVWRARRRAAGR